MDLIEQPASKFSEIFALIRATVGVDFSHYKLTTIRRRIARRMLLHKTSSLDEYIIILRKNADEVDALHQDFLINLTSFFRDPEAFEELQKRFLPKILKDRSPESPLRVWVPGCATGEEVYSIAVCLMETLGEVRTKPPAQIFATDISERAVKKARAGLYPETIAADVSSERLRRFFLRSEGGYQIRKPLRELCVFAPQNLFMDPPFSRMDLISCRNVLIYLGTALQERVLNTLHYALKPSGILLLGVSETTSATPHLFQPEDAGLKFYSKRPGADRRGFDFARQRGVFDLPKVPHEKGAKIRKTDIEEEIDQIVLKLCSPAGVVVNEAMEVVLFRGQTNPFLQPPSGKPTFNILKMAHRDLVLDLRTVIHQARDSAAVVKREGVELRCDGQCKQLNLIAVALTTRENHCMVLFEETTQKPAAQPQTAPGKTDGRKKQRAEEDLEIASIRSELAETKRDLEAIIQEQETSNEALRSANEEILSSNEELHCTNEELQTAKEELQASNEELRAVNRELQNRNAELAQVDDCPAGEQPGTHVLAGFDRPLHRKEHED